MNKKNIDFTDCIRKGIIKYVNESQENSLGKEFNEKAWETPLVDFSKGDDPLYDKFKKDIGDFYWTPFEIFSKTYPTLNVKPRELSVICWILPQTTKTKVEQRKDNIYPVERAILSRVYGDIFNRKIATYVINLLNQYGYNGVAPVQSTLWKNEQSQKYGYASSWSERHAAFVSGLGTFSLNDALITPAGIAMRCGSVVANIPVKPAERKYTKHNEYCLFYSKGGCMKCVERCPANAISENGHDKNKCREYQRKVTGKYIEKEYNIDSRYCGICQFGVPCESCIP